MMAEKDVTILQTIGEMALGATIIEGFLRLHIFEAGRHQMLGAPNDTQKRIEEMKLGQVITRFRQMYPQKLKLAEALELHTKIRNRMFHAFFYDVGEDLQSFEGRDQITILLREIITLQRRELALLIILHKKLISAAMEKSAMKFLEKDDDWTRAQVAESQLVKHLAKLKKIQVEAEN